MFVVLALLLIMGVPIAASLASASRVSILMDGVRNVVLIHTTVNGIDSFPLLAVPFFILAGHLMNTAGISNKIFEFAKALVGWMHSRLGHVNVGASVIFRQHVGRGRRRRLFKEASLEAKALRQEKVPQLACRRYAR